MINSKPHQCTTLPEYNFIIINHNILKYYTQQLNDTQPVTTISIITSKIHLRHSEVYTYTHDCSNSTTQHIPTTRIQQVALLLQRGRAERPCDVSCLSVVSFNSTLCRVQSSIMVTLASDLLLHTNKFCSLFFGVFTDMWHSAVNRCAP